MSMWLCRAGRYGEFENKFLEDSRVYCTWDNLAESIMQFHTKQDLLLMLSWVVMISPCHAGFFRKYPFSYIEIFVKTK